MTTPQEPQSSVDRAQTFIDWTKLNSRALSIAGTIVVVAGIVFWFYSRSRALQVANAERALANAQQSVASGNMALAQTDLQKVFSRYDNTGAGVQAAMLLAQLDYNQGKYQDGISVLEKASGSGAASAVRSTIQGLIGDGYMQMGKVKEAAKAYDDAAQATQLPNERAFHRSKAARAYATAGDTAKAREIWTALEADTSAAGMAGEARVRIGELTARAAKR
jgi:predicted negative regulator of RcsB-dependent stress response